MNSTWGWYLGLFYIFAVAAIWISASYIVQSVVDRGVSPFLITYICNSLFIIYVPLAEIAGFINRNVKSGSDLSGANMFEIENQEQSPGDLEIVNLLPREDESPESEELTENEGEFWTRRRVAGVSLLISPFWFLAQLTFNLSLEYTTVTVRSLSLSVSLHSLSESVSL